MSVRLEDAGLDRTGAVTLIANMEPVFSRESDTISQVVDKMVSTGHRRMPVVTKGGELAGVLTISDVLGAFLTGQDFNEKISAIMIRDIVYCDAEDELGLVLQKFKISRRGGFPVVDTGTGRLAGMVSERDFVKHFSKVDFGIKIKDLMTRKPFFVSSSISIYDCLKTMVNTHYRRLPVVYGGKLVGIVTSADMLRYAKGCKFNIAELDEAVDSIIIKNVYIVPGDADVSEAVRTMKAKDVGGVLIASDGVLEGIITERDVLEEIV
jgi:CBS domain-containing protein